MRLHCCLLHKFYQYHNNINNISDNISYKDKIYYHSKEKIQYLSAQILESTQYLVLCIIDKIGHWTQYIQIHTYTKCYCKKKSDIIINKQNNNKFIPK